ncbi:MAG: hypothetical protein AAGJ08_08545 [Cyanobacteria bacterium P01_H01_bin.35]
MDKNLLKNGSNPCTPLLDKAEIAEKVQKFSQSVPPSKPPVGRYCPSSCSPSANIYTPEEIVRRAVKLNQSTSQPLSVSHSLMNRDDYTPAQISAPADPVEIIRKALKLNDAKKS